MSYYLGDYYGGRARGDYYKGDSAAPRKRKKKRAGGARRGGRSEHPFARKMRLARARARR